MQKHWMSWRAEIQAAVQGVQAGQYEEKRIWESKKVWRRREGVLQ